MRLSILVVFFSSITLSAHAQTVQSIRNRGVCSTAGVEGIAAQLAEAQRCMNPGAFVRFAPHPNITLSSSRVHPYAQASARDALHRAARSQALTINSAFRTIAEQYVLGSGCSVVAAPGRSNHQSGRAVDVSNHSAARSALQAQGCRWLGSSDPVHFDCPGNDQRAESVRAFQRLWNANNPGDRITEDGLYGPQTESKLARTPAAGFATGICDGPTDPPVASGRLRGVVYADGDINNRVPGAAVRLVETGASVTADGDGSWSFDVDAGEYTVEAMADGYTVGRHTCTVASGEVWCSVGVSTGAVAMDGTVSGMLFDNTTDAPISGGQVVITETGMRANTVADGAFSITVTEGSYTLVASAPGYAPVSRTCAVSAGGDTECSMGLTPEASAATLQGVIFTDSNVYLRVIGARVRILETGAETTSREGDGLFRFEVAPGTYTVEVSGAGFNANMRVCEVDMDVVWCSVGIERSGAGGGLTVEEAGNDHGTEADPDDLEAARRTQTEISGCAIGGNTHASWLMWVAFGLVLGYRRRS